MYKVRRSLVFLYMKTMIVKQEITKTLNIHQGYGTNMLPSTMVDKH